MKKLKPISSYVPGKLYALRGLRPNTPPLVTLTEFGPTESLSESPIKWFKISQSEMDLFEQQTIPFMFIKTHEVEYSKTRKSIGYTYYHEFLVFHRRIYIEDYALDPAFSDLSMKEF